MQLLSYNLPLSHSIPPSFLQFQENGRPFTTARIQLTTINGIEDVDCDLLSGSLGDYCGCTHPYPIIKVSIAPVGPSLPCLLAYFANT
jgi:hypothetical protein